MLPKQARYQLRHTPIVIKLWLCRWSNLWSNTFLTAFYHFPNRPKSARLKGFRRFSLLHGANTVYAPKASALPTALHPEIYYIKFIYACEFVRMSPLRFPQKHSRTARLERFALFLVSSPHYARFIVHRTRSQLRPTALHPEIYYIKFIYACEFVRMSPLRFPQKHSRTARLERFALFLVSSPHYARFIVHRTRSQLRPTALHPEIYYI